jgi:hypothetical protein
MAKNKFTPEERIFHLAEVARLSLQGWNNRQIAEVRGVNRTQINYDMKALTKAWQDRAMIDFNAAKGQQLERLDLMEKELWDAWFASKEDSTETRVEQSETPTGQTRTVTNPDGTTTTEPIVRRGSKSTVGRKRRTGNPDYMALILQTAQERSKLLGLYPKETTDLSIAAAGLSVAFLQRAMELADQLPDEPDYDDEGDIEVYGVRQLETG